MASAPGSPGTSLTARSCWVMGSHPSGDSLSLSLSLAARFKPEIKRSDITKARARNMGPISSEREISEATWGGGKKYISGWWIDSRVSQREQWISLTSNAQNKSGRPVRTSRRNRALALVILAVVAPEHWFPGERSCWGQCLEHWGEC